jgi:hypothetical protein
MKKHLKTLGIIFIVVSALLYLLGSFYSASFNIANWSAIIRGIVCLIDFCVLFVCNGVILTSDFN